MAPDLASGSESESCRDASRVSTAPSERDVRALKALIAFLRTSCMSQSKSLL
jgi:hypothetical protein